jgi:hypothetical protein
LFPVGPEGRHFAVVLTHDVEGARGLTRVELVAELEPRLGFASGGRLTRKGLFGSRFGIPRFRSRV